MDIVIIIIACHTLIESLLLQSETVRVSLSEEPAHSFTRMTLSDSPHCSNVGVLLKNFLHSVASVWYYYCCYEY